MWQGPTFQSYYLHIPQNVREFLDKEDPSYLLTVDFDEYLDYLVRQFEWETQKWNTDDVTIEPVTESIKQTAHDGRQYETLEHLFRLRIPLSPHSQRHGYFVYGPSTTRGAQPNFWFEGDVLLLKAEATELAVQQGIENVAFWLGNLNSDIEKGNQGLRASIKAVWEVKSKQLDEGFGASNTVLQKLNIPLHQDPNARIKPIEIKERPLRTVMAKPSATTASEPSLNQQDVKGLVEFIDQYARQFEVAPKSYDDMDEEKLRDLLVGMMNANFPGSTTGETFSKLGKTDISFRVDSGHVLICECKFWAGAAAYTAALDQLFGYLTWRQNYGVLINFSKLKGMTRAVSEASRASCEHASFTAGSLNAMNETRFITRHIHPQDPDKSLDVFHLFVDLSY